MLFCAAMLEEEGQERAMELGSVVFATDAEVPTWPCK